MGFLSSSKERLRLARLRRQVRSEPRPHAFAELARGYLALGDRAAMLEALALGESFFPAAPELTRLRARVAAEATKQRLTAAKAQVREQPSPAAFLELAESYSSLGRADQCVATLREALERFGENVSVLTAFGEFRYRRFLASRAAADARAALAHLERAAALDAEALKPRFLLAELLFRSGADERAAAWVGAVLALSPDHGRALQLREEVAVRRLRPRPADAEDVESQWARVEEQDSFGDRLPPWERGGTEGGAMVDPALELHALVEETAADKAALIDDEGRIRAGAHDAPFASLLHELAGTCRRAARGMELGAPQSLLVEGAGVSGRSLVLEMKRDATLGLLAAGVVAESAATAARDSLERMVRDVP